MLTGRQVTGRCVRAWGLQGCSVANGQYVFVADILSSGAPSLSAVVSRIDAAVHTAASNVRSSLADSPVMRIRELMVCRNQMRLFASSTAT
jgi:hypothetical protein